MPDAVRFTRAILCPPADTFAAGLTTAAGLGAPDLALARQQHAVYAKLLERLGVALTMLPADPAHPDSTFVEDAAVVTARGAILARPGAPSRRGEVEAMRRALAPMHRDLAEITDPGTLDGGDICQAGEHFFIGLSARTNAEGAAQLGGWLAARGYTSATLPIHDDPTLLHLKSGLAWLGRTQLVAVSSLAGHPALVGWDVLVVPDDEAYAANCIRVGNAVIIPAGFPGLAARIAALGYKVHPVEMSEFRKMDGGPSCLSVRVPGGER